MQNYTLTKMVLVIAGVFFLSGFVHGQGQPPNANFTENVRSGCAPLTVRFTDQSTGNPTEWSWEFSNGTLSSLQNPIVTFSLPGTYSAKLIVRNADGIDELEKVDYITVYPSPVANFTSNLALACVPAQIQFTDMSTVASGSIIAWDWNFGDGGTSTQQNPTHTYTTTGFYTVTLTVTSGNGCTRTVSKGRFIRIVSGVTTDFNYTLPASCRPPFAVTFVNQSSGPGTISYSWNFGNGQTSTATNPIGVFNTPGTYTVTLNAQSNLGCSGSVQKTITLAQTTTDFAVPANICVGQPITFQNTSSASPVTSFWDFGDGTTSAQINATKTFLAGGTYTIKLVNQYANCMDSVTKTVTVNALPLVDFSVNDSTSCSIPFTAQFTDLSPGATSWQWNFGDGGTSTQQNPSHQYTSYGTDSVTLTITTASGCTNSLTKPALMEIQDIFLRINAPDGGCAPFTYTPRIDSIYTVDPIASYAWDLGDGTTSTLQNPPPHVYAATGNYTISLTVTSVSGCTKSVVIPNGIRVGTPPVVDFTPVPASGCAGDSVRFTDNSITSPGAAVEWDWDFGDGSPHSFIQNPAHLFVDTGTILVTLTVSNNGCRGSVQKPVQIQPPVASFTHTVDCNSKMVTFTNTSLVNPGLLPLTYAWDFGDGTTSTLANPTHTYAANNAYQVQLTVTNGPLCSYTYTDSVIIADEKAAFTISKNPVCRGELFTLTATGSNPTNIVSYEWRIGTGTVTSTSRSVNYRVTTNGTYDVQLIITDVNGCADTLLVPNYLTVNGPTADFVPATPGGCEGKVTTFTDLSTPSGAIINWDWNFGDGTTQNFNAGPFTHTYTNAGTYQVSLKVTDTAGCTSTRVLPAPLLVTNLQVGFRADTFYCPQAPLQFVDSSSGAGLTYLWDFGDGNTSTLQNPTNSFPLGDADYTIKLKVTDIAGCQDSVTKQAYVKIRSPKAAFGIQDTTSICTPLRTSFTFMGKDYESYYWDFGDGGSTTLKDPYYFYSNYGHYIPKLYLRGPGGCVDSAEASVTLYDPANAVISYGPVTSACNSLNVDFNLTVPPGFKFIFYYGDGAADSTGQTALSHFYSRPSFNTPLLFLMDTASGCQAIRFGTPRINVLGAVPLFGKDKKEFCDQGDVTFKDFTTKNEPIISSIWDFGDGTTSTTPNPTHTYTQPGLYVIRLDVTTQSNCSSSFSDTVMVYRTPVPSIASKDTVCVFSSELIEGMIAQPDSITNWSWTFGNGQTSSQQNNNLTFNTPGDYSVQLTTSNKLNCSNTITKNIHVVPLPTGTPAQDPITIIVGTGTSLGMNYTGPIASYTWLPTTGLSCTDCPDPYAQPQFTTKYTVQLTDRYGCTNTGEVTVVVVCNNQNFFVPNTFSPNGDGRNDVFYPRGTGLFRIQSLRIFNRWGQIMFEKRDFTVNDPASGWDGTFKGRPVSPDVYVYTMEIICDNNTIIPVKGNITLLR